jgi:hypothetical protein
MSTTVTVSTGRPSPPAAQIVSMPPVATAQSLGIVNPMGGLIPVPPEQMRPVLHDYSDGSIRLDAQSHTEHMSGPYVGSVSMPRAPKLPFSPLSGGPWSAEYPTTNVFFGHSKAERAKRLWVTKQIPKTQVKQFVDPWTGAPNPQAHFEFLGHCPVYVPGKLGTCIAIYQYWDGIPTLAGVPVVPNRGGNNLLNTLTHGDHVSPPTYVVEKLFPLDTIVGEEWAYATQKTHYFLISAKICKPLKWAILKMPGMAPQLTEDVTIVSDNQGIFPVQFSLLASVTDDPRFVEAKNAFKMDYPDVNYMFDARQAPLDVLQRQSLYERNQQQYQSRLDQINQARSGIAPPSSSDEVDGPAKVDDIPDTTSNKEKLVLY